MKDIDIRNKLISGCPKVFKQAGYCEVDFGSLFLEAKGEEMLYKGEEIGNTAISTVNNINKFVGPEAKDAIVDATKFIMTDLIEQITAYSTGKFKEYLSTRYGMSLLKNITSSTVYYTKQYTKNPALILNELRKDNQKEVEDSIKDNQTKAVKEISGKCLEKFGEVKGKIDKIMNDIMPYQQEIEKYMVYGPDRLNKELVSLYKKYYDIGISYVDTEISQLEEYVNSNIDYLAMVSGKTIAEKINNLQEKKLKQVIFEQDKKLGKIKLKAVSKVKKAILKLLSMVGG